MRRTSLLLIIVAVAPALWAQSPEPPAPLPVLPAKTDTTALRAALQLPLDPPEYHFRFDETGRFDVLDRGAEAAAHIADVTATLKNNASDAKRYDELRLWHYRRGETVAVHDCALRAARCYRDRLLDHPYNADLLSRLGETLIDAGDLPEAERRLRRAVAADPDCWRAWYVLARVQIDNAYALQAPPAGGPDGPNVPPRSIGIAPRPLPPALRVDLPSVAVPEPPADHIEPVAMQLPGRIVPWLRIRDLSDEAETCLNRAVELAPDEPAVRFARCCQRKLAAEVLAATEGVGGRIDPFEILGNLDDVRATVNAHTDDPDVISVATWFEINAAQKRLENVDDPKLKRATFAMICERIERLEAIATRADKATAARSALLAAHLCRKVGQPFRAGVQLAFAANADPDSRPVREAYLAALAESGPPSAYQRAAREAAERFDIPPFRLRLADALARSGDTDAALREVESIRRRDREFVLARLAEAVLLLQADGPAAVPRVNGLLDGAERMLRAQPAAGVQVDCALLRACSQMIGGNAALGRMMLEDLARHEPWHPRVKAALAAVE